MMARLGRLLAATATATLAAALADRLLIDSARHTRELRAAREALAGLRIDVNRLINTSPGMLRATRRWDDARAAHTETPERPTRHAHDDAAHPKRGTQHIHGES